MDEITENELNPLINNQNKTIMCVKIKQVYQKLEKDLMSIFDGLRNNSKNERLNDSRNWQSNDLNGINNYR
jgi:Zn-dependent M32 family carboxypeptidase